MYDLTRVQEILNLSLELFKAFKENDNFTLRRIYQRLNNWDSDVYKIVFVNFTLYQLLEMNHFDLRPVYNDGLRHMFCCQLIAINKSLNRFVYTFEYEEIMKEMKDLYQTKYV